MTMTEPMPQSPMPTSARPRPRSHASFWLLILALIVIGVILCWHFGIFNRKPRIAMVAGESAYFEPIVAGAREAERQYDVRLTVVRAKGDAQADAVKQLLNDDYDGVAVSPINPESEAGLLSDVAAKTTLVTFDSDTPVSNRLCFVGTDNYAAGRICGQQVRQATPEGGEVLISCGALDKENVQRRRQGVIDELIDRTFEPTRSMDPADAQLKGPKHTIVLTVIESGPADEVIAKQVKALKDHPDVKCVVGLNALSAPRLLSALEQTKMLGKVKVVGFDPDPQTLAGIEAGNVYATVVQDQFGCGFHTVRILAENARGDKSGLPMFQRRTLPVEVVSKYNVAAVKAQLEGKPMPASTQPAPGAAPTSQPVTPEARAE